MLLLAMRLRRKKKLLRKKSLLPSCPHMKKMRILSPTTMRIVMKEYADSLSASIRRVLKTEGEVQTASARAK
jgi:hypothetical protein